MICGAGGLYHPSCVPACRTRWREIASKLPCGSSACTCRFYCCFSVTQMITPLKKISQGFCSCDFNDLAYFQEGLFYSASFFLALGEDSLLDGFLAGLAVGASIMNMVRPSKEGACSITLTSDNSSAISRRSSSAISGLV